MGEPGLVTDIEKTYAMFAKLSEQLHDIHSALAHNTLDVDEFTTPSLAVAAAWSPQRNYYLPIVVEYVLATFPVASTTVTIQLGDRIIPVTNIAAGIFAADLRMQLEKDDARTLNITPPGVGYLEIMGHATSQVMDRK